MPNWADLMRTGRVARTLGPRGLFVGGTWPSFYMGLDPSYHGIYWLDRIVPGTYRSQRCTKADFGRYPVLWETLSEQGRRVLVLDVPLSRYSPQLNGVQVVEWGVHDQAFGFRTHPPRLGDRILAEVGPHPVPSSCDAPRRTTAEYVDFAERLARGASARARMTRDLIDREPWDFMIQVFSECHCAGHQLWHFHDRSHPGYSEETTREVGDLVHHVYRAVDTALGEVVSALSEDTILVVATLHGMSHACGASLLLDRILGRLGAVDDAAGGASPENGRRTAERLKAVYHRLPERVRRPLYELRQRVNQRILARGSPIGIDPARVRAFHVGLGLGAPWSGIRLNLRGREPAGQLEPGHEADGFVADLIDGLQGIVDADTGVPIIRNVHKAIDLFAGPRVYELPDLLVEWNPDHRLGSNVLGDGTGALCRVSSPRIGELDAVNSYCRGGEHRGEGMLVARAPGLNPGEIDRTISTMDLAPTFARILGCSMPSAAGRVIPELLDA